MYKNTSYTLRALVLGTLLAATGLGFASANTTTTTNAPTTTIESTKAESTLQAPTVGSAKAAPSNVNVAKAEASTKATPVVVNKSIGTPQDIQKIRAHIFTDVPSDFLGCKLH